MNARDNAVTFHRAVSGALALQLLITLPACVGLASISQEVVSFLLGPNWASAASVLALLALSASFAVFQHTGGYALMAIGKIRIQAMMLWFEALAFAIPSLLLISNPTPVALAQIRLVSTIITALAFMFMLSTRAIGLRWIDLLHCVFRPLVSSFVMAGSPYKLYTTGFPYPFLAFITKSPVGVGFYFLKESQDQILHLFSWCNH